jgi:hypothetical protein
MCASELLEAVMVTVTAAVRRPGGALRDSRGPRDRDKRNEGHCVTVVDLGTGIKETRGTAVIFRKKSDLVLKSEI